MDNILKKNVIFVTFLGSFLTAFMGSSLNIALPVIAEDFHMEAIYLSWVATSYLLTSAIFLIPMGKIADINGRKKIYLYGMIIYTFSSLLCMISFSSISLILFRVVQGIGASMIFATSLAIVSSVFAQGERGKALGINVSATYMGLSCGPIIGGFLTHNIHWRAIFAANIIAGAVVIYVIIKKMKNEWKEERTEKFDYIGSLLYGLMMFAIMYGISILPDILGFLILFSGISLIVVFILWELKIQHPILNLSLFRTNVTFALSNVASLINYCATFAVGFLMSLYLQYNKGFTPQEAGFVLVIQPVAMAICAPIAGRLSDKVEPRIIASIGMAITVVGLLFFEFLGNHETILFIVFGLVLLGSGLSFFSSPNTNAIMSSVEKKDYSVASATLGTMRLVGQMVSMAITTLLFAIYVGNVKITPDKYPDFLLSMKTALIIFAVLCFFGIFASLARGKVHD